MADDRWDALENAYPTLAASFPGVKPKAIRPMGMLEKLLGGSGNVATTDIDGTIAYNKEAAMRDGRSPDAILAHELQHVKQNSGRGLLQNLVQRFKQGQMPWGERPDEQDAQVVENRSYRRTQDIRLPASVTALDKIR